MTELLMLIAVVWVFRRFLMWITFHLGAFAVGVVVGWRLMDRG